MEGELFMMLNTPFFKQRYSISMNFYIGCRLNCQFCYYKMSEITSSFFLPGASLKEVGSADMFADILRHSRLVFPDGAVMVGASSDCSMNENRVEIEMFLDRYASEFTGYRFFLLHRPPWSRMEVKAYLPYESVVFATTITPLACEKRYNSVKDDSQIKKLIALREKVPPDRISIELGPIGPDNIGEAVNIANFLYEEGVVDFITVRGVSLGSLDREGDMTIEKLIEKNFITREKWERIKGSYGYWDGHRERRHTFYLVKNYLADTLYDEIRRSVPDGLRIHRNTATLYRDEYGIPISLSRNNKPRRELVMKYGSPALLSTDELLEIKDLIEQLTGRTPYLSDRGKLLEVRGVRATEDIAHRVGRMISKPVIFDNFTNQPTIHDVMTLPAYREILSICNKGVAETGLMEAVR